MAGYAVHPLSPVSARCGALRSPGALLAMGAMAAIGR
jgi:hypothetical protein